MKKQVIKVMIFGTFDGLHKGHLHFFSQARKLAENAYLIASIARDKNVFKIKGSYPEFNEQERLALVVKCKLIDKVILGDLHNYMRHIVKESPEIIALGYDQDNYTKNLDKDLKRSGLETKIVRLKPYKEHIYKNKLLKSKIKRV